MKYIMLFLSICITTVSFSEFASRAPASGQTVTYQEGDDGDLNLGEPWPDVRFKDLGNGVVSDSLTGLEWIQNPHTLTDNSQNKTWGNAVLFCENLTYANEDNWRLPTIKELESLINCGSGTWGSRPYEWLNSAETPFLGIEVNDYWSSTTYARNETFAMYMDFHKSEVFGAGKVNTSYVWPVRVP